MKYFNQKSGLNILAGKVKEVADGSFTMDVEYYEKGVKEPKKAECTILTRDKVDLKKGYNVTVPGYQAGPNRYNAEAVMNGNAYYESDKLAVLTGFVTSAKLNEEKDENGAPKKNKDGKAKQPHYDIAVSVKQGDEYVTHRIKIYDHPEFRPDAIAKAQKMFASLGRTETKDGKEIERGIYGTFITTPGETYENTYNGRVYKNCTHMGFVRSPELEYLDIEVKENTKAAEKALEEEVKSSGDGFVNIPDEIDEELPFN